MVMAHRSNMCCGHHSRVSGGEEYQNRKHCNLVSWTAKQPQCQCAKRSTTLFGLSSRLLIITDIASTRHTSIEIVPLVVRRSYCASCCWIADHARRKCFGRERRTLLCDLGSYG